MNTTIKELGERMGMDMSAANDNAPPRHGRYIRTATGRQFWPHDPRPEDIFPQDIAHSLARIQRYGGHASKTYSVAEHCCLGSDYLRVTNGAMFAFAFLLHDATEALGMGDVPAPTKAGLPEYKAAEEKVEAAVDLRFMGRYARQGWLSCSAVKEVDARITTDEMQQIMYGRELGMPDPLGITLRNWGPSVAQHEWLSRFENLYSVIHGEEWSA